MNRREIKYYFLIVCVVGLYIYAINNWVEKPAFHSVVTNILALISAVTFWMQLKRTENLNEANYIMNLNYHFINNKKLIEVEKYLSDYYATGRKKQSYDGVELDPELKLELGTDTRQELINYLVYLEAMAAIMQRGVMHLDVVDDLFAYRFFIAVNNPMVQKIELIPYSEYYQGCFALAKAWTDRFRDEGREIPLDEFSLCKTQEAQNMPSRFKRKMKARLRKIARMLKIDKQSEKWR